MDATDEYFTHTIVGAPMTAFLGQRSKLPRISVDGVEINLRDGKSRFTGAWEEWMLVRALDEPSSGPRRRPRALRRWIERNCLLIGCAGIALSLFSLWTTFVAR